ncbi:unnamed protein product [Lepidochelys kempii]
MQDTQQCHMKIKELRQAYQKTKEANVHSGSEAHTCRFYDQLHGNHLWSAPVPTQGAGGSTISGAGGPPPPTNVTSNRRLQQTQAQVDEVVDIMRVNVDKVLERDQKLSELDNRADALQAGASQFETSAAKLKRKYWWKNCKMMIILGVVCAVILIVIIIYFCT